jgi:excisionase family DNA binding protein
LHEEKMISSIAIVAAEGSGPEEMPVTARPPTKRGGALSRQRASAPDDLEERIGSKLIFSINELAALADRSPATIFRLLRLGQLPFVQIGGSRCFTRAAVLNFLRRGTQATA